MFHRRKKNTHAHTNFVLCGITRWATFRYPWELCTLDPLHFICDFWILYYFILHGSQFTKYEIFQSRFGPLLIILYRTFLFCFVVYKFMLIDRFENQWSHSQSHCIARTRGRRRTKTNWKNFQVESVEFPSPFFHLTVQFPYATLLTPYRKLHKRQDEDQHWNEDVATFLGLKEII